VGRRTDLKLLDQVAPGDNLAEAEHDKPVDAAVCKDADLVQDACVKLHDQEHRQAQRPNQHNVLHAWNFCVPNVTILAACAQPVLQHGRGTVGGRCMGSMHRHDERALWSTAHACKHASMQACRQLWCARTCSRRPRMGLGICLIMSRKSTQNCMRGGGHSSAAEEQAASWGDVSELTMQLGHHHAHSQLRAQAG
jgi:hypothetical protein